MPSVARAAAVAAVVTNSRREVVIGFLLGARRQWQSLSRFAGSSLPRLEREGREPSDANARNLMTSHNTTLERGRQSMVTPMSRCVRCNSDKIIHGVPLEDAFGQMGTWRRQTQ